MDFFISQAIFIIFFEIFFFRLQKGPYKVRNLAEY